VSEKRPWATKSAAQRFGFVACPACNPNEAPSGEIPKELPCAWCYAEEDKTHRRFVLREVAEKWAKEHGQSEDDIQTSPQTRGALAEPPPLPTAATEPAPPPFRVPIKREEE